MAINEKGQFLKGSTPHNKREFISCRVAGCDRTDHKGLGYCSKHYKLRQMRIRLNQAHDDISLEKRLPRTEEHKRNNVAYFNNPNFVSKLKGKTFEELHGVDGAISRKKRMSDRLKGIPTGKPSPMMGKKQRIESVEKMRASRIGQNAGNKNYFWRDGSSLEKYGSEFNHRLRESVRDRDGRKCAECGCPEAELEYSLSVHHIDCNKKNNCIDNLISLCRKCHSKVHWSNEDWRKYFCNSIKENIKCCPLSV